MLATFSQEAMPKLLCARQTVLVPGNRERFSSKVVHFMSKARFCSSSVLSLTHTDTLANLGDERHSLLAITISNCVLAALPGQFQIKIVWIGRQIEHVHAVKDPSKVIHIDVDTKGAENYAEEAISINGLAVHHVRTRDRLLQFEKVQPTDWDKRGRAL